jgi:hypothetical protein
MFRGKRVDRSTQAEKVNLSRKTSSSEWGFTCNTIITIFSLSSYQEVEVYFVPLTLTTLVNTRSSFSTLNNNKQSFGEAEHGIKNYQELFRPRSMLSVEANTKNLNKKPRLHRGNNKYPLKIVLHYFGIFLMLSQSFSDHNLNS